MGTILVTAVIRNMTMVNFLPMDKQLDTSSTNSEFNTVLHMC